MVKIALDKLRQKHLPAIERVEEIINCLPGFYDNHGTVSVMPTWLEGMQDKQLAFCQPKPFYWATAGYLGKAIKAVNEGHSVIGMHHAFLDPASYDLDPIPDDVVAGVVAHEMEHAVDYYRANNLGLLAFGIDYGLYEGVPNDADNSSRGGKLRDLFFLHEKYLDLRAIDRGNGKALQQFREYRPNLEHLLDADFNRENAYLGPEEIETYMTNINHRREEMAHLKDVLGTDTRRRSRQLGKFKFAKIVFDSLRRQKVSYGLLHQVT